MTNNYFIETNASDKWETPPLDSIKINWDAAYCRREDNIGLGVVVQYHKGMIVGSL